jgi:hypothetical protein
MRNEVRQLEDMNVGLLEEFLTPVNTFTESQIKNNLKTAPRWKVKGI